MNNNIINDSKRLVVKIGSSTITGDDGHIDMEFLEDFAKDIKMMMNEGKKIIIVSSGARIAGVSTIGKWSRKEDINYKQALCAIGQVELMDSYRKAFEKQGIHVAQILLTKEDFDSRLRTLNIRNTLFTLLDEGVIPIINENDTVSVDEIKIGDNDMLAAFTTVLWGGDLLVLLSDIQGICDKNPNLCEDASIIDVVKDIETLEKSISLGDKGSFGTGGIVTKLKAAKLLSKYNTPMIVAYGKEKNILYSIAKGDKKGTLFIPKQ